MVKTELPFVVGVLADLSGAPKDKLPAMKERSFTEIDRGVVFRKDSSAAGG